MQKRIFFLSIALLYSTQVFAFFCPKNFQQINLGDSIQQVQQQCGAPDAQKSYKTQGNVPQEWTYYVPISSTNSPSSQQQGTMKLTIAFTNNQVTNITSNGIGVGSTTICNNNNIQIGTSMNEVKQACGTPAMIVNAVAGEGAQGTPPTDITEYKYNSTPSVTLIFENGVLKSKK